jgi:hypothetical protein
VGAVLGSKKLDKPIENYWLVGRFDPSNLATLE